MENAVTTAMIRLAEINIKTFIEVQNAFNECDSDIQDVICQMIAILRDKEAADDEKHRAMGTVLDALFPFISLYKQR